MDLKELLGQRVFWLGFWGVGLFVFLSVFSQNGEKWACLTVLCCNSKTICRVIG